MDTQVVRAFQLQRGQTSPTFSAVLPGSGLTANLIGGDKEADSWPVWYSDLLCVKDFHPVTLRKYMPRLAVAIGIFFLGMYFNNCSQAWLQKNMENYYSDRWEAKPPHSRQSLILFDFGHHVFPHIEDTSVADFMAGLPTALVAIRFYVIPGPRSMRWTILCRVLMIWGVLWALRGLTIVSTVLPNPDATCKPRITFPDNVFMEALAIMPFMYMYNELTCLDVLFSGHTVGLTLSTLTLLHYVSWAPWFKSSEAHQILSFAGILKIVSAIVMCAGWYVIVATKFHYTADVLVGAMMTVLVFKYYHFFVRDTFLPDADRVYIIYPFVQWMECEAADVIALKNVLDSTPSDA